MIAMSSKKQNLGTKAVGIAKVNIGKSLLAAVGGLVGVLLAGAVHATATIEDIEFSARPGSSAASGLRRAVTILAKDAKTGAWAKCVAPSVTLSDRTPPTIAVADDATGWSSPRP